MVSESQYGIVGLLRFADGDAAELPLSAVGALCCCRVRVFGGCCKLWEGYATASALLMVAHPRAPLGSQFLEDSLDSYE